MSRRTEVRLAIVGAKGTGKTSTWTQWIQGVVVEKYECTISDSPRKIVQLDGCEIAVEIFDMSHTEFQAMRELVYKNADGLIILYSITDPDSFSAVSQFKKDYDKIKEEVGKPSIMLVWANKTDLVDQRKISTEHGEELAKELQVPVIEASTLNKEQTEMMYMNIIRRIMESTPAARHRKKNSRRPCLLM